MAPSLCAAIGLSLVLTTNQKPNIAHTKSRVFYEPIKHTYHAEQLCIQRCKNKAMLKKCTLILVRITDGTNVQPCSMCAHIIKKYGIPRVKCYYVDKQTVDTYFYGKS